jgi:uncharacterized protein
MDTTIINDAPNSNIIFILAHGAGAGMSTDFMNHIAQGVSQKGVRVIRFEFPYMTKSRNVGKRRAPDSPKKLKAHFLQIIEEEQQQHPTAQIVIGGKSMGGRIASILTSEKSHSDISGCICLGYPFHPPGKPEKLRTDHLQQIDTPCLIIQGTRDPFGKKHEVETYTLDQRIKIKWIEDGEHSLKTKKTSKQTWDQALDEAVASICTFLSTLS